MLRNLIKIRKLLQAFEISERHSMKKILQYSL